MKIQLSAIELEYILGIYNRVRTLNSERESKLNQAKRDLELVGFVRDDKLTPQGKEYIEKIIYE